MHDEPPEPDGDALDDVQEFDRRASAEFAQHGEEKTKVADAILWERLASDTAKSFEAFGIYRDQGPSRSYESVARRLQKSGQLIRRWARVHNWPDRVAAFDSEQDRIYYAELATKRRAMRERHANIANTLQALAMKAIELKYGPKLERLTAKDLKDRDLLRFLMEASRLERISYGDPSEIVENQMNGGNVGNEGKRPIVPLTEAGRRLELDALFEAARARAGASVDAASPESEAVSESSDD